MKPNVKPNAYATRSLLISLLSCLLLAASAAAIETNRPAGLLCQNSNGTSPSFGDAPDVALQDVTMPGSSEPLACVICSCAGAVVYYWGTASCAGGDPTCTEIHDGVARALPKVQLAPSMAVPALSLLGAVVLAGGILSGTFFGRRREG